MFSGVMERWDFYIIFKELQNGLWIKYSLNQILKETLEKHDFQIHNATTEL